MEAIHKEDNPIHQQGQKKKKKGVKSPDDSECANLKLMNRKLKLRLDNLKTEENIRRTRRHIPAPWYREPVELVAKLVMGVVFVLILGTGLGVGQWLAETYIAGFLTGLLL